MTDNHPRTNSIDLLDDAFPCAVLDELDRIENWDDRRALQNQWTLRQKGWLVEVEWKDTPYGLGVFAAQDIQQGTVLRVGKPGRNLVSFESKRDIDGFLGPADGANYDAKVRYLSDYLFGNNQRLDWQGHLIKDVPAKFLFCVLIPGFGSNHSAQPNIRVAPLQVEGELKQDAVTMVALRDIQKGEEMRNAYQDCGPAPEFVKDFAKEHNVSLVFPGSNDFV